MTIDTSTTAGKIAVMQAYVEGKSVQVRTKGAGTWHAVFAGSNAMNEPVWAWDENDYRIMPEPKEFYIVMDKNGPWRVHCNDARAHANAEECQRNAPRDGKHYVIKVREVIE